MKKHVLVFMIISYLLSGLAFAQGKRDFFTMVKGDSLAIFLIKPPSSNEKYNVFRKEIGVDKDFVSLTEDAPVKAIIDAEEARMILGDDYEFLKRAMKGASDLEMLRTIRSDGFRGGLLSLISRNAAKVAGRWFLDENIKQGKEYEYKLVFVNSSNVKTDSVTKRIVAKSIVPLPPKNVSLESGDKLIKVKWEYPAWKGDFNDLGFRYDVYRKIENGEFEKINNRIIVRDDATTPEYDDLWLEEGKKYYYYVTISDPMGNRSKPSEIAEIFLIDKTPPAIVRGLTTTDYDKGIALGWDMNLELDLAGYKVFRSLGLDKEFIEITDELIPANSPYYLDTTALARTNYFYSVAAVDTAGNIGKKSNPIAGYKSDKTPPETPSGFNYKIVNNMVELLWNKSSSKDVEGYIIYRGKKDDIIARINENLISSNAFVDSGYKNSGFAYGGKFVYQISAIDSSRNESEKITLVVYAPDKEAPLPPNNFRVSNKDGLYVEVSCGASSSPDAKYYKLFKSEQNQKEILLKQFEKAPFKYRDTSVVKGKGYIYGIAVIDTAGNESEIVFSDAIVFKDFSPPPAPRNGIAKFVNNQVELKWGKSVDFDLAGYNVYRSDHPTGKYIKLNDKPISETKYADSTGNEKYFYRIRAVDTSGNESKFHKTVPVTK